VSVRLPAARRRDQLLDVALDVFAAKGFHATSMDDVAEAAGVTKPVVYQHFRSKRALYMELLDEVGTQLRDAIVKAGTAAGGPRRQVEAGCAAYFRFVAERRSAFRLMFGGGARRDEEFADAVRQVEESIADTVAGFIEADIDDEHRRILGHAVVGMAEGTSRYWLINGHDFDPDQLARRIAELAWAGLRGITRD
jgi:AcrR family transcriptional regulator